MPDLPDHVHLQGSGQSLLLDLRDGDPRIVHWGADLGAETPDVALFTSAIPRSSFDVPVVPSVVPQASRGWRGTPGLRGSRDGAAYSPLLELRSVDAGDDRVSLHLADDAAGLSVTWAAAIGAGGLLVLDLEVRNTGDATYTLDDASVMLTIPDHAVESFDLTGRWLREKHPQRRRIDQGSWQRIGRHGRTGHDATAFLAAGTDGFSWRQGEVWALHLGWSGGHRHLVERHGDGHGVLGAGELLGAGEVVLAAGEGYSAPTAYAAYSSEGLDGVTARFHDFMRARPQHPSTPRPVILNTWEAVYLRHDPAEIAELADLAASIGVERLVLDDGWFRGRDTDTTSLGDWFVDERSWPEGLKPLADRVHALGMQFGLWVEPEMVNEDSDLAREHPDWISGPDGRRSLEWRSQQVVDLVNPDAFAYVLDRIDAIVGENDVDYLKWDENRDQFELGHDGRESTREQTLAAYRLFDELRLRHPALEIESCSSGGARVDLGILERTDRVWASDCNDALERQTIQRYTGLIVPPELVGAHVGPTRSHSTARTHDLSFRAATALGGHFGIEWDIREASDADRTELAWWIAFYKEHRALLHSGRTVRGDHPDAASQLSGVVAHDGSAAVYTWATLASSPFETPPRLRFPGLDAARRYRIEPARPMDVHDVVERTPAPWLATGATLTGAALDSVGLPAPVLHPEHAVVFVVTAVD